MLLTGVQDEKATLGNVASVSSFSIKATAKSFAILSSSLYSNKIRAIVQELGANAKDSHKEAGKEDVPFEVHLPSIYEPFFHIRDFGVGLDHEQVMNLYTTYFASTKNDSNDYVGALGLGSKTPFSYTTNFSVIAIKNGRQGVYTAFIDDNGIPSIALMSETTTEECNGVTISFSVNSNSDMRAFKDEVISVYSYFKVKPNIIGDQKVTFQTVNYIQENIIPGVHLTRRNPSNALMGEISYPIDRSQFNHNPVFERLLNCGLTIEFNIGELDIQANREGLSYIALTKQNIETKLKCLSESLVTILEKDLQTTVNLWEQAKFLIEKKREVLWEPAVVAYLKKHPSPLFSNNAWLFDIWDDKAAAHNIYIESYHLLPGRMHAIKGKNRNVTNTAWQADAASKNLFVIGDLKKGNVQRAKFAMKRIVHSAHAFLMLPNDPSLPMDVDGFLKELHNPTSIIKASDVKIETNKTANKTLNNDVLILTKDSNSRGQEKTYWASCNMSFDDCEDDEDDSDAAISQDDDTVFCYVDLSKNTITSTHAFFDRYNIDQVYGICGGCGIPKIRDLAIYGVRKNAKKFVLELSNWIPFEEYMKQCVSAITEDEVKLVLNRKYLSDNLIKENIDVKHLIKDPNSPFLGFVETFKDIKVSYGQPQHLDILFSMFGTEDQQKQYKKWVDDYELALRRAAQTYPLLDQMARRYSSIPKELRAEYINDLDELNTLRQQREINK